MNPLALRFRAVALIGVLGCLGALGIQAQSPRPKRLPQWDSFRLGQAGKKWQHCTITEIRVDRERVQVFIDGPGMSAACNHWLELAENLGNFEVPADNRKHPHGYRSHALNLLGDMGWEIVSVHSPEKDRTLWVLKREIAAANHP